MVGYSINFALLQNFVGLIIHTFSFTVSVTDPNLHTTVQYSDYDGRQVQVTDAQNWETRFMYDAVGQLLTSIDPEGFTTTYTYDKLGRLTALVHPDAGMTHYSYDPSGNVIQETTKRNICYLAHEPMFFGGGNICYLAHEHMFLFGGIFDKKFSGKFDLSTMFF